MLIPCPHKIVLKKHRELERAGDTKRNLVALWWGANWHPCWSDGRASSVNLSLVDLLHTLTAGDRPIARWLVDCGAAMRPALLQPGFDRLVIHRQSGVVWLADPETARSAVALQRLPDADAA